MPPFITQTLDPVTEVEPAVLEMDEDGVLWLDYDGVRERLGHVTTADAPREFWAEQERLLSDWRDSFGGGHRDAAIGAYERAQR
jgi:hypothetical protein